MNALTYGVVYNEYYDGLTNQLSGLGTGGKKFTDYNWDAGRARACVCDGGWTGLSCELRMCLRGYDIMDTIPTFDQFSTAGAGNGNLAQVQIITLYEANLDNDNFASKSFAIQFTSKLSETFVTQPIMWSTDDTTLADYIETALKKLPNKVVDDVDVSVDSSVDSNGVIIDVTFKGLAVQGKQHKLELLVDPCGDGCNPKITGLTNLRTHSAVTLSTVSITTDESHSAHECGRRGKCDYNTGLCDCFDGFIGDTCNILTSLV